MGIGYRSLQDRGAPSAFSINLCHTMSANPRFNVRQLGKSCKLCHRLIRILL